MTTIDTEVETRPDARTGTAVATKAPAFVTLVLDSRWCSASDSFTRPSMHNGAHDARHANGFPCH